jgi:uncharacterized protein
MIVDWNSFTPWTALAGGVLIGLAAALLLVMNGRIAGISGILGGVFRCKGNDCAWRAAFVGGLVFAPFAWRWFGSLPQVALESGSGLLIAAGLLVGFGTRLGSGCTSGHGVCGLARLSPRSLAATLAFMATGFATVYLVRHVWGGI